MFGAEPECDAARWGAEVRESAPGSMAAMGGQTSVVTPERELALPARADLGLLALAVTAVSTSGPLIAAISMPALAIAFWRNAIASCVLVPVAFVRRREIRSVLATTWRPMVGAGLLLAAHFAAWTYGVKLSSVASATALVATQPAWSALMARVRGAVINRLAWLGIALAIVATGALTGFDVTFSRAALVGDLLALAAGMLAAGYVTVGAVARRQASTVLYTTVCYGTAACALAIGAAAARVPFSGYPLGTWLKILALTGGAQLLGHSVFNHVLRTTSPTVVSLAILFEVPGAAAIAALTLHQQLHLFQIPALAVLIGALGLVVFAGGRAVPAE